MNTIAFPALVKNTGCDVLKVHIPETAHPWIMKDNPDIVFLDKMKITRIDGVEVEISNPRLSRGPSNSKYVSIPRAIVREHGFKVDDEVKVELTW